MLCVQWQVTPGQDHGWRHVETVMTMMGTPVHLSVSVPGVSWSALIDTITLVAAALFPVSRENCKVVMITQHPDSKH